MFGFNKDKRSKKELNFEYEKLELDQRQAEYRKRIVEECYEFKATKLAERKEFLERTYRDKEGAEHDYHSGLEKKKTELARLDALIKAKQEYLNEIKDNHERLLNYKDKEILRLNDLVNKMVDLPGLLKEKALFSTDQNPKLVTICSKCKNMIAV